jgi:hypothetical protein
LERVARAPHSLRPPKRFSTRCRRREAALSYATGGCAGSARTTGSAPAARMAARRGRAAPIRCDAAHGTQRRDRQKPARVTRQEVGSRGSEATIVSGQTLVAASASGTGATLNARAARWRPRICISTGGIEPAGRLPCQWYKPDAPACRSPQDGVRSERSGRPEIRPAEAGQGGRRIPARVKQRDPMPWLSVEDDPVPAPV